VIVLRTDRPLAAIGRAAQSVWNWVTGGRRPVTILDKRLLAERDTISAVLGQAVLLTAGRLGFDYGCRLAALRAIGAEPRPSLVLLAYSAAGIIGLFAVTPCGLGHRGGQPQRPADPGRRPPRLRSPGRPRISGRLLLAPATRRSTCSSATATDRRSPARQPGAGPTS
jgi:hypothetical protein